MKIYTKTGDKGKTSLLGGRRVSKSHDRIDAYGTVDEVNAFIGLLHDNLAGGRERQFLEKIQNELFVIGSYLASEKGKVPPHLTMIDERSIEGIEREIDWMNSHLTPLKNFILPGGHPTVSYCHLARCVCRRAERIIVKLTETEFVEKNIIVYMNRLSDFLFVLARKTGKDLNVAEINWKPK